MKKIKKCSIYLTILIGIVILVAGCSNDEVNDTKQGQGSDKTVLEYYTWTDEEDYMKKVVDSFNSQHEDIQVNLNTISNNENEYDTKMMNNLSGGSKVDVYSINGTAGLGLYHSKNQLVNLTDHLKEADLDIGAYGPSFQDVTDTLTDGKYYALPYRTSQYAIYYNKEIFDKEGIDYPSQMTWQEYADLAKKLTKGEGADKQWGGYYADWVIAPLGAIQSGSTIFDDDLSEVSNWLEFLEQIYYEDQSHMSYKQMKAESIDWIKQFEVGNVAMLINGEWTINMLNADIADGKTDIQFDMAPLPLPDDVNEPTTVGGVSTFIGINPKSEHTDAGLKFVEFLAGEEGESIIADANVLPALSNDATKEAFLNATGLEGSNYFFEAKTYVENLPVEKIDQVNQLFSEQRDLFLFEEQDINKTIQNFVDQRQSILK